MEIGNPLPLTLVTFSVTGPATYQGGTQQYVSTNTNAYSNANSTYIGGVPDAFYHSPGDPELQVEGGMTRIALRSQFTPGTVTVTATAPGLASGSASFTIVPVPDPRSSTASCTTVPSAPTGLTATAASSSVISLTWTAVNPPANCSHQFLQHLPQHDQRVHSVLDQLSCERRYHRQLLRHRPRRFDDLLLQG